MNKEKPINGTKFIIRTQKIHKYISKIYEELYSLREEIEEAYGKTPKIVRIIKKQKGNKK